MKEVRVSGSVNKSGAARIEGTRKEQLCFDWH